MRPNKRGDLSGRGPDYYTALAERHAVTVDLAVAAAMADVAEGLGRLLLGQEELNAVWKVTSAGLTGMREAAQQEGRAQVAEEIAELARRHEQEHDVGEFEQGLWTAWHLALSEEVTGP